MAALFKKRYLRMSIYFYFAKCELKSQRIRPPLQQKIIGKATEASEN